MHLVNARRLLSAWLNNTSYSFQTLCCLNAVSALTLLPLCPSPRWVQVLPETAALHSLLAHRQRAPPVGQRLGPAGPLPAAAELPGDPEAQDPAHCPQALWPQHPLPPQPQPPDASGEVGGNTTSASSPPPQKLFTQSHRARACWWRTVSHCRRVSVHFSFKKQTYRHILMWRDVRRAKFSYASFFGVCLFLLQLLEASLSPSCVIHYRF